MITGNCISDDAKIIGITPPVLTLRGILVEPPPTSLFPATFCEYCTGILLSASWRTTTRTTRAIIIAIIIAATVMPFARVCEATNCVYSVAKSAGIPEMILIKSTIEIPLPTPFSVILSPIHINTAEPAVSAITTNTIQVAK